jgi:mono/diheme cytochrome c family protein
LRSRIWSVVVIVLSVIAWFALSPPRLWLNLVKQVEPTAAVGAQLVEKYNCRSCHQIAGKGALKAPNLASITQRVNDPAQVTLRLWLQNPRAINGNTAMPNFRFSDSEIEAILYYLHEVDR